MAWTFKGILEERNLLVTFALSLLRRCCDLPRMSALPYFVCVQIRESLLFPWVAFTGLFCSVYPFTLSFINLAHEFH